MSQTPHSYDESSIRVLKGLDPIRLRPGQFTRVDSPLHIAQEVIDNAVDEALAGQATLISVTLGPGGEVEVQDNGRGIPVGIHKEEGIPVVQAIFTVLYSGGKFNKGDGAYNYAGGLHGVGVSVTNALSSELTAEVRRDGKTWKIGFRGGEVSSALEAIGPASDTGTTVRFRPDPKYFASPDIPVDELRELLRSKAVLLPGLRVVFTDARSGTAVRQEFHYENGLTSYLQESSPEAPLVPVLEGQRHAAEGDDDLGQPGEGAQWALSWYESGGGQGKSFVNLIQTPEGGTHVAGLRAALFETLRRYIEQHAMLPRGVKLTADDVFKTVRYVLSVKMLDPSFDNQTKDRLNSRGAVRLVERAVAPGVEAWLSHNPALARQVAEHVISNASSRQRLAQKTERRKSSSLAVLPGKLADCESSDPNLTELFLVEGDSAGGSAKQARNKEFQAILPLRGKSLNVWEKSAQEALSNDEISDIAVACGASPGATDLSSLRYGKICVLADADVDGFHIQCLLLTLFFRHFPELIRQGKVFVAQPPLYRIDADAAGKSRPAQKLYAMDEQERAQVEEKLSKKGYARVKVGRFKGLGEMNPSELWETTLNPDTRRLLRVDLPPGVQGEAKEVFDHLMGKAHAGWRREWMERRGHEISAD